MTPTCQLGLTIIVLYSLRDVLADGPNIQYLQTLYEKSKPGEMPCYYDGTFCNRGEEYCSTRSRTCEKLFKTGATEDEKREYCFNTIFNTETEQGMNDTCIYFLGEQESKGVQLNKSDKELKVSQHLSPGKEYCPFANDSCLRGYEICNTTSMRCELLFHVGATDEQKQSRCHKVIEEKNVELHDACIYAMGLVLLGYPKTNDQKTHVDNGGSTNVWGIAMTVIATILAFYIVATLFCYVKRLLCFKPRDTDNTNRNPVADIPDPVAPAVSIEEKTTKSSDNTGKIDADYGRVDLTPVESSKETQGKNRQGGANYNGDDENVKFNKYAKGDKGNGQSPVESSKETQGKNRQGGANYNGDDETDIPDPVAPAVSIEEKTTKSSDNTGQIDADYGSVDLTPVESSKETQGKNRQGSANYNGDDESLSADSSDEEKDESRVKIRYNGANYSAVDQSPVEYSKETQGKNRQGGANYNGDDESLLADASDEEKDESREKIRCKGANYSAVDQSSTSKDDIETGAHKRRTPSVAEDEEKPLFE